MEPAGELKSRLKIVRSELTQTGFDGILLSNPFNVKYLTGYNTGRLLVTKSRTVLWVRSLYRELYSYPSFISVRVQGKDSLKKYVTGNKIKSLLVEDLSYSRLLKLRRDLKVKLKTSSVVEDARVVKSRHEVNLIRRSCSIAKKGMLEACRAVKPGVREVDAAARVESIIRSAGSETPPFREGMLLCSGSRASDVHAHPSIHRIKRGLVVVDLGARYGGYYSDMTRSIPVGRLTSKEKRVVEFVEQVKEGAVDRVEVGLPASEIHSFVEERLRDKGFVFHHSTGHGVGLEVHEKPSLSLKSRDVFREGMVFTIEPGVYLAKKFGVRFEDTYWLRKKKIVNLTCL